MPVRTNYGRQITYRAYGANGELLGEKDLGSDEDATAWARRLIRDGLSVTRLSRELTAGFGMDIPLA